jgi:hypothetical protein
MLLLGPALLTEAGAQNVSGADPYNFRRIETVAVLLVNPSDDEGLNARVEDQVRTTLELFPDDRFSREGLEFRLSRARRVRDVSSIDYEIDFGNQGGLALRINVTLATKGAAQPSRAGFLENFPVIYDRDGTYIRFKLDLLSLYYANNNAWYGRPDLMLAGNPLVDGEPSGEGYDQWLESYLHYGLYGITPVTSNFYVYAGVSAMLTNSVGQEIFTDRTRTYHGVEDAYIGGVGGRTDAEGNRFAYNLMVGRKRFTLGQGMLLVTTSANGEERAALQANARWAADFLGHARFRYNDAMLEFFYLDPDELPLLDTGSTFAGVNLEFEVLDNLQIGLSYITSPEGDFSYFGPNGETVGTREGLRVYDARFNYTPMGPGRSGPFLAGELALQNNKNFDMEAYGGYLELGYSFTQTRWTPTISYRYGHFTGDDPDTEKFERWDPLLSGGGGELWIQSVNHFKVVQNSNVQAHRLQGRLRPSPKVELVPQLWAFNADSLTNVGGNPALTFLEDDDYGYEANITAKWFANRNTYVHGHVAYTWPGRGTRLALGNDFKDWFSVMLFVRYAF